MIVVGNRTTKQVCSRVQKYFIKLHKAGLPIPGRAPKMQSLEIVRKVKLNLFSSESFMRRF